MRLEEIKQAVEQETNQNLNIRNRKREMVYARAVYFKLCKQHTRASLSRIGKSVGKDHATVLHGIKVFDTHIGIYEDSLEYKKIFYKLDRIIRREKNTTQREIDPASYYRDKYKDALLNLREVRNENRLLKKQIV
tara:strand:+ start:7943 stop:8347 length:405 start_codon:yes stop_codon:yes gene_type:complete